MGNSQDPCPCKPWCQTLGGGSRSESIFATYICHGLCPFGGCTMRSLQEALPSQLVCSPHHVLMLTIFRSAHLLSGHSCLPSILFSAHFSTIRACISIAKSAPVFSMGTKHVKVFTVWSSTTVWTVGEVKVARVAKYVGAMIGPDGYFIVGQRLATSL